MKFYDVQTRVRISTEFYDQGTGNPVDPADVFLYVEDPDGNVSTYNYITDAQIQRVSTGKYRYDVDLRKVGRWIYQYQGIGNAEITSEAVYIQVRQTPFTVNP